MKVGEAHSRSIGCLPVVKVSTTHFSSNPARTPANRKTFTLPGFNETLILPKASLAHAGEPGTANLRVLGSVLRVTFSVHGKTMVTKTFCKPSANLLQTFGKPFPVLFQSFSNPLPNVFQTFIKHSRKVFWHNLFQTFSSKPGRNVCKRLENVC